MRLVFGVFIVMCLAIGFGRLARAQDATVPADPVRARLDDARAVNAKAHEQAAGVLRAAIDQAIAAAEANKQADATEQLKSQEQAFTAAGTLPAAPELANAVAAYREAIKVADSNLERACSRAVRHYAAAGHSREAIAIEREKSKLHQQLAGTEIASPAPSPDASLNPTAIAQALDQAKARYRTDVNEARQVLLAQVDAKVNDATNAGDLAAVRTYQTLLDQLNAGADAPESASDASIAAFTAGYHRAVQTANVRMARAFAQAVRDQTRARQLDQAEATQAPFVATGLAAIDLTAAQAQDGSPVADTTYVLGRRLPDLLTTGDRWEPRDRGIFLQRHAYIRTKNGDYLDRDFVCDLWFTTETTGTDIFLGLGSGRGRPDNGLPLNALALYITSPDNQGGTVWFLRADGQMEPVGRLDHAGEYVARIQKSGPIVVMSVGDEDPDGTFNPRFSVHVTNPASLAPFMTPHNAHLFFGGGRFWKIRYINGKPPAVVPATPVKSLMGQ